MKTITEIVDIKTDATTGFVTITARVEDKEFGPPAHRQTAQELCTNKSWYRGHRVTEEAFSIFSNGRKGFAILQRCLSKIAAITESELTWSPLITAQPASVRIFAGEDCSFTVKASGEFEDAQPLTYQWFESLDGVHGSVTVDGEKFKGSNSPTLAVKAPALEAGYYCVIKSAAGETVSEIATVTLNLIKHDA